MDCSAGGTIAGALKNLKPADMLVVNGTCNERVEIPPELTGITLDGRGKATINGPASAGNVVQILARETTVKGFTITGGRNGVGVFRGAAVVVDGDTIQNTGSVQIPGSGLGINVAQNAFAAIVNTIIRNNPSAGILVHESSAARIGFIDVAVRSLPNLIEDNGGAGIQVTGSANARIVGATIINNKGDGVLVERSSQAEIADNTIGGNGGHGIEITGGSGVAIEIGAATVVLPNKTDGALKNAGYGIRCSLGGYVGGRLGTLTGNKGVKSIDRTCVDALRP